MVIYLILGIIFLLIFLFWFSGFLFGASFQSSSNRAMTRMIKLSSLKKGEKVADLGSGSGKLVIEFAKKGAVVTGFEINPFLVWLSRTKIKKQGLEKKASIKWQNFWNVNLSNFDVIILYQIGYIMNKLEKKLKRELKNKKTKVVSNTWKFKSIKPLQQEKRVFLYRF